MDFVRPRLLLAPRLPASNLIRNTEIPSMFNPSTSVLGTRHRSLRSAVVPCWCTLLIVTTLTGCAGLDSCHHYIGSCKSYVRNGFKVGPEYCKPAAPVADGWIDEYDERVRTELPNYADWWSVFNDPVLDRLMEETYQQNLDLKAAGLRVLQARYIRAISVGGLFPQSQEHFGSYTRNQNSQNISGGALPLNTNTWVTGFDAFWELDVWGKFRRNIESADASLDASIEDYDAILISLLAETASTYVDLRTAQQRLEYAKSNVGIQEGGLKLADVRLKARAVTKLDVTQAENIVANTEQLIPLYENQIRVANNALCVLLGIPPRDLTVELGVGPIPMPPADVVVGVPANLLRRRPDVRAAERQVAAQSAAIGVATADLLPHFSITGSISLQADRFDNLFESASTAGAISPGFSWDILNYGRLINNVRLQDAAFQELAVNYQQTVLQANAEAENAINTFLTTQERLQRLTEAVDASSESVEISLAQYRTGATDYNRVFNLQTSLVSDQDTLAATQGQLANSLIAAYKAIGGGWEIRYGIRRGSFEMIEDAGAADGLPSPVGTGPEAEQDELPPVPTDQLPPVPTDE
jgi:NodT family efflux transporter outer membrane factor (OMF) lipoprotein